MAISAGIRAKMVLRWGYLLDGEMRVSHKWHVQCELGFIRMRALVFVFGLTRWPCGLRFTSCFV